jgi:histidine ammonia-lyase
VSNNKEIVSVTTSPSVDALREKSSWIENVAMNYGLTTQGVQSWMDRFESEVINCKLKTHANQKDLASHFCDWLRIKLTEQRPQSRMQSTNDKMTAYIQSLSN